MPESIRARRALALLAAVLALAVFVPNLALTESVSADSAVIVASADTYILSGQPNENHGSDSSMDLNSSRHGLIRFDLSTIPTGSTITNATLTVVATAVGSNTSQKNYHVYRNLTDWGEATATWNTPAVQPV